MPNYKIPVVWQMAGNLSVEAPDLAEAERIALNESGLPEGHYIEDSIELDFDHSDYGLELPKGTIYN